MYMYKHHLCTWVTCRLRVPCMCTTILYVVCSSTGFIQQYVIRKRALKKEDWNEQKNVKFGIHFTVCIEWIARPPSKVKKLAWTWFLICFYVSCLPGTVAVTSHVRARLFRFTRENRTGILGVFCKLQLLVLLYIYQVHIHIDRWQVRSGSAAVQDAIIEKSWTSEFVPMYAYRNEMLNAPILKNEIPPGLAFLLVVEYLCFCMPRKWAIPQQGSVSEPTGGSSYGMPSDETNGLTPVIPAEAFVGIGGHSSR